MPPTRHLASSIFCVPFLVMMIVLSPSHSPALEPVLTFAYFNTPPLSYHEDGEARGILVDVFKEAAQRAGFAVELQHYPAKRVLKFLQDGTVDGCIYLYRTQEREEFLYYPNLPLVISRAFVFVLKGSEFPFKHMEDLYGKRMGVLRGWAIYNPELEQEIVSDRIIKEEVQQFEHGLKMLALGRIDCFLGTEQSTWYTATRLGIHEDIVPLEQVINEIRAFTVLSKAAVTPDVAEEFIQAMDTALEGMYLDGTHRAIQERYHVYFNY